MEKDIFDLANDLIEMLEFIDDYTLISYVAGEIRNNGYCDESGYSDFIIDQFNN